MFDLLRFVEEGSILVDDPLFSEGVNPNKAELFEGSFSCFKKNLSNINITL